MTALENQVLGPDAFEVVVVDDGSTDDTWEVLERLRADSPLKLTLIRNDESQGPAAGRNRAWQASKAPVVAFTDDDCEPTSLWLYVGAEAMAEPGRIGVGRVIPHPGQMHLVGPFSYTLWVDEGVLLWFATANLFYRRTDLEAVGGFDESYRFPAGEDTDLGLRIVEHGAKPTFLRRALVYHDVRPSSFGAMLRDQRRWQDIPGVVARHPILRQRALTAGVFWKQSHARLLLLFLGVALTPRDRRALALTLPWLHYRTCVQPLCEGPRRRWAVLPGAMAIELNEMRHMIRGSIRHRTFVL